MLLEMVGGGAGSLPPGDPAAVRGGAHVLAGLAAGVGSVTSQYQLQASGLTTLSTWSGQGSAGFSAAVGRYEQHLRTLESGLRQAASILDSYAGRLEAAQALARTAAALTSQAQADAASAQSRLNAVPPLPASVPAAQAAQASAAAARAQAAINDGLSAAVGRADAMGARALADAARAAAAASAALDGVRGSLASLAGQAVSGGHAAVSKSHTGKPVPMYATLNSWGAYGLVPWGAISSGIMGRHYWALRTAQSDLASFSSEEAAMTAVAESQGAGSLKTLGEWYRLQEANPAYAEAVQSSLSAAGDFHGDIVPPPLAAAEGGLPKLLDLGSRIALPLGMLSDVATFLHPHPGVLGVTDMVASAANFGASGLALSDLVLGTAFVPGVGEAVVGGVLLVTAAYFAATFVSDHWQAISNAVTAADSWVNHQEAKAMSWATNEGGKALGWVDHSLAAGMQAAGHEVSHALSSADHVANDIGSSISHALSSL